jgi:1-acyl-sn-glycerol-3-phosphate acyltransferase
MLLISYLRVITHIFRGFFIVVFLYPKKDAIQRHLALQNWSLGLLKVFNIELQLHGEIPKDLQSHLVVSNHISWLDIHVINALFPMRFVEKKEVASWPVFGWFAKKLNTLFIDRQKSGHSRDVSDQMALALREGDRICIFPEGTSSDGLSVLKFKPNLFQSVIDAESVCLPTAISYIQPKTGELSIATAFIGDMGLLESMSNTLKNAPIIVRVHIGEPIKDELNRKVLSEMAWQQVMNLRN